MLYFTNHFSHLPRNQNPKYTILNEMSYYPNSSPKDSLPTPGRIPRKTRNTPTFQTDNSTVLDFSSSQHFPHSWVLQSLNSSNGIGEV